LIKGAVVGEIVSGWEENLRRLRQEEKRLEDRKTARARDYGGLVDWEELLSLASIRFRAALEILEGMPRLSPQDRDRFHREAGAFARGGKRLLEELAGTTLGTGEREKILADPRYAEAAELFRRILLSGGEGFFEGADTDAAVQREISRAVASALRKYAPADDNPSVLFRPEDLPPILRKLTAVFFPVMGRENLASPPYGIPEGEEKEYRSGFTVMPLSQGILFLEEELLPRTMKELKENPGDRDLQDKKLWILDHLAHWKRLRFFPRATPVLLNQDFYTHGLSQYTQEGEPLVRFALPLKFKSGTNLDRYGEMVRAELVRRLAGRGLIPGLDRDYRYRKSLRSGRGGSSRTPSFKLDTAGGFRLLKEQLPGLAVLEDRSHLGALREGALRLSKRDLIRQASGLLESSPFQPPAELSSPE
jgi:hypothetical protein